MEPTRPRITRSWAVTFPFGRGSCSLLCVGMATVAAATLVWFLSTLMVSEPAASPTRYLDNVQLWLIATFTAATALTLVALWMRRLISRGRRALSRWSFLPAAVGHDGRLHVEKYRGECPSCGGTLRFYNKPVRWHEEPNEGGGTQTVVDERHPAIECRGDLSHWWRLTPGAAELAAW